MDERKGVSIEAFVKYLWASLVVKLGPAWWGIALTSGLLVFAVCSLHSHQFGVNKIKALAGGTLTAYVVIVVAATVLSRRPITVEARNLLVAGGVANLLRGGRMGSDALANAFMLLPVGALLPVVTSWNLSRTTLACMAFSTWIEAVQLVCCLGYPELFDVFLNTLGGAIGYALWALIAASKGKYPKSYSQST